MRVGLGFQGLHIKVHGLELRVEGLERRVLSVAGDWCFFDTVNTSDQKSQTPDPSILNLY